MLEVDIPGFGRVTLEHLVSDYTGSISPWAMQRP
jgi:hypothetical protein